MDRSLRSRARPVHYNHYQRTGDDGKSHESRDEESEGSVYDYQEEQDWGDDEGEYDESNLLDAEEGLSDRAYGSDEDDLTSNSDIKSERKRPTRRSPSKGKDVQPQEDPEVLKRAASLQKRAGAALEKQRRLVPPSFSIPLAQYVSFPNLTNTQDFIDWASSIMESVGLMDKRRLHPVMSMLYIPWQKRPTFREQRDSNGPVRSPWRKDAPDEKLGMELTRRTGAGRTAQKIREERLDVKEYQVKRDIPWLPDVIPLNEAPWKVALYTTLGATPDDLAHRVALDDAGLHDKLVCHKQLRNRIKKRIDDWLKANGGFQWLDDRQNGRARKGDNKVAKHDFASAILGGVKNSKGVATRAPVSELGYFFNTTWEVDVERGVMIQPGGNGTPHPLWAPRQLEEIPKQILQWRKNVAKLPELTKLEDLVGGNGGRVRNLHRDAVGQVEESAGSVVELESDQQGDMLRKRRRLR